MCEQGEPDFPHTPTATPQSLLLRLLRLRLHRVAAARDIAAMAAAQRPWARATEPCNPPALPWEMLAGAGAGATADTARAPRDVCMRQPA